MCNLDDDAKLRLERVMSIADSLVKVRSAVRDAISGIHDGARKTYLRDVLTRAAARKLREELKKRKETAAKNRKRSRHPGLDVTGGMILDAHRHEVAMHAPKDED